MSFNLLDLLIVVAAVMAGVGAGLSLGEGVARLAWAGVGVTDWR